MTFGQRLDALIAIANELGHAEADLARYRQDALDHAPRTVRGRHVRLWLANTQRRVEWCRERLASARARLVEQRPRR